MYRGAGMYCGGFPRRSRGGGPDQAAWHPSDRLHIWMPAPRISLDQAGQTVPVIIPAMNEARNLPWLADRVPVGVAEIILVDGRSIDDTVAAAMSLWPGVRIVHQNRRGKGNALACGFAAATGDIIVMIDRRRVDGPGRDPLLRRRARRGRRVRQGQPVQAR